jgi:hypothetical protein
MARLIPVIEVDMFQTMKDPLCSTKLWRRLQISDRKLGTNKPEPLFTHNLLDNANSYTTG